MSIICGWVMLNAVFAETNLLSDYHYAEIAYEHQQYELALRELAPLVEAGQAEAQYLLARMQQNGQGMAANIPEAVKTYHLSAQQGYMPAQLALAQYYDNIEHPGPYDPVMALKWFLLVAEQGNAEAKFEAARLIEKGIMKNDGAPTAIDLLTQAAEQGHAVAQYWLGLQYDQGLTVEADFPMAFQWFSKAAAQGLADAQLSVANMYERGEGVELDHQQAMHFYKQAAMQGNGDAQYSLGIKYYLGEGVTANLPAAIFWMTKADNQGILEAGESLLFMLSQQSNN